MIDAAGAGGGAAGSLMQAQEWLLELDGLVERIRDWAGVGSGLDDGDATSAVVVEMLGGGFESRLDAAMRAAVGAFAVGAGSGVVAEAFRMAWGQLAVLVRSSAGAGRVGLLRRAAGARRGAGARWPGRGVVRVEVDTQVVALAQPGAGSAGATGQAGVGGASMPGSSRSGPEPVRVGVVGSSDDASPGRLPRWSKSPAAKPPQPGADWDRCGCGVG